MNHHTKTLWSVIACIFYAAHASAQDRKLSEKDVVAILDKSLPTWDRSVLDVKDGPDWSAQLNFNSVLKALGEGALRAPVNTGDRRIVDGQRVLRLTQEQGRVRFVERSRTWNPAQTATNPVDPKVAMTLALGILERLGVPRAELVAPRVDLQLGLDEDMRRPTDRKKHTKYSLVSVQRNIGKLEVYGSRARIAITNAGSVQRLRLSWPAFRMAKDLTLRQRDAILKEAVATIMRQSATPISDNGFIQARLAYVPETATLPYLPHESREEVPSTQDTRPDADDDLSKLGPEQFRSARAVEPVHYLPAVVIAVSAAPTPYELLIPVAE
ncbi:MAG TPA: hypothetical protein VFN67_14985 [Polyangiales bacterium]|nr:hypothetical protein [Polyangiales bacterium]